MSAGERGPRRRRGPERPPLPEPRPGFTGIGVVVRPHGLRGELRVHPFNPEAPHLGPGARIHINGTPREIRRTRHDRDAVILEVEGVTTRTQAESLRGSLVEAADADIRTGEDEHLVYELIGMEMVTAEGEPVGRVVDVLQPGANDVYVVQGESGERLVPAIGEVVHEIDTAGRRIVITPLPGLLDESGY